MDIEKELAMQLLLKYANNEQSEKYLEIMTKERMGYCIRWMDSGIEMMADSRKANSSRCLLTGMVKKNQ
jgi:hypothetical protein